MIFMEVKVWRDDDARFKEVLERNGYKLEKVECKNRHSENSATRV